MHVLTLVLKQAAPVASIAVEIFLCSCAELVADPSTGLGTAGHWSKSRESGTTSAAQRAGEVPHFNVTSSRRWWEALSPDVACQNLL